MECASLRGRADERYVTKPSSCSLIPPREHADSLNYLNVALRMISETTFINDF
jgi:hypothetical protein